MNMARVLNEKFAEEIDRDICKGSEYIEVDRELRTFIRKEFSQEKAEHLDDLLGIIISAVGDAYTEQGIKQGARFAAASWFKLYYV